LNEFDFHFIYVVLYCINIISNFIDIFKPRFGVLPTKSMCICFFDYFHEWLLLNHLWYYLPFLPYDRYFVFLIIVKFWFKISLPISFLILKLDIISFVTFHFNYYRDSFLLFIVLLWYYLILLFRFWSCFRPSYLW
jgi:hypothetical protein